MMRTLFQVVLVFCLFGVFAPLGATSAGKRPLTFEDLFGMKRVSDPQVSPDGKTLVFTMTEKDVEGNSSSTHIYSVPMSGGSPRQLTNGPTSESQPRWSPDGSRLYFVSGREGGAQVWWLPSAGGEARKLTELKHGASGLVVSPTGKHLLVSGSVPPAPPSPKPPDQCKAKIIDSLLYRHWVSWKDGEFSHLFVIDAETGKAKDLTEGFLADVPPISLSGGPGYGFSPDGQEICFAANTEAMVAKSTNNDLFSVPVTGGKPKKLTTNPANDNAPVYSADGRYIAYRAMERPGFEADRYQLMLYERKTGSIVSLTGSLDRSVGVPSWSDDGQRLLFVSQDEVFRSIYSVSLVGDVERVLSEGTYSSLTIVPGGQLVFGRQSMNQPLDFFVSESNGTKVTRLTRSNDERVSKIEMNGFESFWFDGAEGDRVQGMLLKPPSFDPNKKYPMVFLIHGGPQGAWTDLFHYRWNAQMFAAPGYVVAMINPRGSTGYGQEFTDGVSGDWGGKPYVDLMKGLDYILQHAPYVDPDRVAAAGASYGGYMVNWIAGQTDRFRCLVSHAGLFNLEAFYGSTEELWFPEWEFGGTPYEKPDLYQKWSPSRHAKNMKTPMLLLHGELDFRCPIGEGLALFTALQRQGIPSRLVYFPDEGHHIGKPQNAELWWSAVYDWLGAYLDEGRG